ncbi:hypothetical protein ACIRD2_33145 [Streptomyces sp. NPDC093595]|uniref:hypothetical protein n=1 Tax=Streptomyces sp. NPDC093595 TaxID=3366045 RepID=UPI003820092E
MSAEPLMALAGAGATALIGAMATDAWQGVRGAIVRLFGRGPGGPERGELVATRLDEDAELVGQSTEPGSADEIRRELLPVWRRRLVLLLEEQPDAEGEFRELIERVRGRPAGDREAWVQHNTARDQSTLFAVQGGSVHYHQTAAGDRLPPSPPREE